MACKTNAKLPLISLMCFVRDHIVLSLVQKPKPRDNRGNDGSTKIEKQRASGDIAVLKTTKFAELGVRRHQDGADRVGNDSRSGFKKNGMDIS